jgi:hypothetical protein
MDKSRRDAIVVLFSCLDVEALLSLLTQESPSYTPACLPDEHTFARALETFGDGRYTSYEARMIHAELSKRLDCGGPLRFMADFATENLRMLDGEVVCRHANILSWRDTTHHIGQMPFACAFLAYGDVKRGTMRHNVSLPIVLRTDNLYLRNILSQGMAENHHHLKGSAPAFLLAWLSLMNDMENRSDQFKKTLKWPLHPGSNPVRFFERMYALVWKAAYIRAYLFARIHGHTSIANSMRSELLRVLTYDQDQCLRASRKLKCKITQLSLGADPLDYAIQSPLDTEPSGEGVFSGESTFQYRAFYDLLSGTSVLDSFECDLFYAYLMIGCQLRGELVQCNGLSGFDNFNRYQDRKGSFLRSKHKRLQIELPLEAGLLDRHLLKFETRFIPDSKPRKFRQEYQNIADAAQKITEANDTVSDKLYLVAHIPKGEEKPTNSTFATPCRNRMKRTQCKHIALTLNEHFQARPLNEPMILGIDACSAEMGCRPEAFAQAFRYLRELPITPSVLDPARTNRTLRVTYHVGEDILDIVDGLRAIDEAMIFFEMRAGDRLGHALALGLVPKDWYLRKSRRLFLPRQDLLDNLSWMIQTLKCEGALPQSLFSELEGEFMHQFNYVYRSNIPFGLRDFPTHPQDYHNAWMLRGDDPACYEFVQDHETFKQSLGKVRLGYDEFSFLNTGSHSEILDTIRRSDIGALQLHHHYHFNEKVHEYGAEVIEYEVSTSYIEAATTLQRIMAHRIASRNIGIETNLTSNYLISNVERYDEHPILRFNDAALANMPDNPHLLISINTDDLGVFETNLENEYALLARSIEQLINDDGKPRYAPADIYNWLDSVRIMGLRQSWKSD